MDTVSSLLGGAVGGYVVVVGTVTGTGAGRGADVDVRGGTEGIDIVSLVAVKGSSSNMEGAALVFGVSPVTDILCLYKLISSASELKSVSTVNWFDSRLSLAPRKAPGFARNLCASESEVATDCLREPGGESREMERWDAVSASESASSCGGLCVCEAEGVVGDTGGSCKDIFFVKK